MKFRLLLILVFCPLTLLAKDYTLSSPDGIISVEVSTDENGLSWSVKRNRETVLLPSNISLEVEGVIRNFSSPKAKRSSVDEVLDVRVPVKYAKVRDQYNSLILKYKNGLSIEFRAYADGAAYRFISDNAGAANVVNEISEWIFPQETTCWWAGETRMDYITHCEALFKERPISGISSDESISYLPLTLSTPTGTKAVLTETDLRDYPNLFLRSDGKGSLNAEFPKVIDNYDIKGDRNPVPTSLAPYIARTEGKRTFPWRVLIVGDDATLLETTLPWQLASREADGDWSWLKPGKVSWEWWSGINIFGVDFKAGINTATYRYIIDFAADYGIPYVLLDEGWSASTLDITHPREELDLQSLISYGKSKGVGVVLWTLWSPMIKSSEEILDVYQAWGVAGVKIDFMQMQDQNMVRFYEDFARQCAARHLLVDYHGAFKPAGLQRLYPNAMTFEGVLGMEHDKDCRDIGPSHDLTLPFTRMVAGPMDYTPGAVGNATADDFAVLWYHPISQGTRSHQAALFVVCESPLMMICDSPSKYRQAPDFISYISRIPTVWTDLKVQEAKLGEYVLLSRETSDGRWYSAALTDWNARDFILDTSFLGKGFWTVTIHRDGANADMWAEDYALESCNIEAGAQIPLHLAKGGGWVAEFVKAE